jgi:Small nuclear RNA activating complex (SNAPc), subunit 1
MLPYRLRAPPKAGPWKSAKEEDPFLHGGPMQRAIEEDILEIRPDFLHACCNFSNHQNQTSHPAKAGATFSQFASLFGAHKIGLLHSCTIPPRCDHDAYAQLIYASCLSLMRKAMEDSSSSSTFEQAAFGLFSLYAFYQTCPLPKQTDTPLQMLPMGLQGDNPKKQFRRHFATRIRIDPHHYSLLQQLQDDALAKQADCQGQPLETCSCSVATDVLSILYRLDDCWDYSMYTGPRSVEGLAGHADYPFGCVRPRANQPTTTTTLPPSHLCHIEEPPSTWTPNCNDIVSGLGSYRRIIKSLVVPKTSHQSRRVRSALDPIFSAEPWEKVMQNILHHQHSVHPRIEPVEEEIDDEEEENISPPTPVADKPIATTPEEASALSPSFQVTLPIGLRAATAAGIHKCIATLFESGAFGTNSTQQPPNDEESSWQTRTTRASKRGTGVGETRQGGGTEALRALLESANATDTVSIMTGTSATSRETGEGRAALKALLSSISTKKAPPRLPFSIAGTSTRPTRNQAFLVMASRESENQVESDEPSDVSSVSSEDDEVSVATSAVGQAALRTLLLSVNEDVAKSKKGPRKERLRPEPTSKKRKVERKPPKPRQSKGAKRVQTPEEEEEEAFPGDGDDDEDGSVSIASSKHFGKAALDHLLAQVAGCEDDTED